MIRELLKEIDLVLQNKNELWDKRADMLKAKHYNENDLEALSRTIERLEGKLQGLEYAVNLIK